MSRSCAVYSELSSAANCDGAMSRPYQVPTAGTNVEIATVMMSAIENAKTNTCSRTSRNVSVSATGTASSMILIRP